MKNWRQGLITYRRLLDVSKRYWTMFLLGVIATIIFICCGCRFFLDGKTINQ